MKRTRLSLGPRQTEQLLFAINMAIDYYTAEDDEEEDGFDRRQQRDLRKLREVVRKARAYANVKGREA